MPFDGSREQIKIICQHLTKNRMKTTATQKIKDLDLAYYSYSYPCITIFWKGIKQPMGMYKTALEALIAIDKLGFGRKDFKINTPDKLIDLPLL